MVADLTGLPTANASLLDEAHRRRRGDDAGPPGEQEGDRAVRASTPTRCRRPSRSCETRAEALGIEVVVADLTDGLPDGRRAFGVLVQYPGADGAVRDLRPLIDAAHEARRAGRGRRRPAGPDAAGSPRASSAPTWWSAPRSASACRCSTAVRTPATWPCAPASSGTLPGRLVGVSVDADGAPGVPARPADPRAAHPPGEGDLQHLHRAGAAGRGGLDVRRLPRPGRAAARSPRRTPPVRRRAGRRPARGRRRGRHEQFFDTVTRPGPRWRGRGGRGRARERA